ncbi:MAG: hypothetical protein WC867_03935 [Candidatus Pacearchaeota archaeon]|jgi:hypothetical protein
MKAYYWRKEGKKEFYLVPHVLFGYDTNGKINPLYDLNILENLSIALYSNRFNQDLLERKGFEFYSVDIPNRLVKRFIQACSKLELEIQKDKNSLDNVLKLADLVFNKILDKSLPIGEIEEENNSHPYRDSYYEGYSINDYEDEWYLRGEEPPMGDDFSEES